MMRKNELQDILNTKFSYLGKIFPYKELNGDVLDLYQLAIDYAELALSPAFANALRVCLSDEFANPRSL